MDGTKSAADTHDPSLIKLVGGRKASCAHRSENLSSLWSACGLKILAIVAAEKGENPFRRKGKGSSALLNQLRVSRS